MTLLGLNAIWLAYDGNFGSFRESLFVVRRDCWGLCDGCGYSIAKVFFTVFRVLCLRLRFVNKIDCLCNFRSSINIFKSVPGTYLLRFIFYKRNLDRPL